MGEGTVVVEDEDCGIGIIVEMSEESDGRISTSCQAGVWNTTIPGTS